MHSHFAPAIAEHFPKVPLQPSCLPRPFSTGPSTGMVPRYRSCPSPPCLPRPVLGTRLQHRVQTSASPPTTLPCPACCLLPSPLLGGLASLSRSHRAPRTALAPQKTFPDHDLHATLTRTRTPHTQKGPNAHTHHKHTKHTCTTQSHTISTQVEAQSHTHNHKPRVQLHHTETHIGITQSTHRQRYTQTPTTNTGSPLQSTDTKTHKATCRHMHRNTQAHSHQVPELGVSVLDDATYQTLITAIWIIH